MTKNSKIFFAITLSVVLLLKSGGGVCGDRYWEYWSKYSLEVTISKKIGLSLEPQFKFKDNFREFYYSKTYFGSSYKLNKFITIKGYYAYKTKKEKTGWKKADLLYLDPILRFNLWKVNFSNRFRWEYDFDKKELVYRNRLKLEKSLYKSVTPFIQEEIFYSFLSHQFEENRFSLGCSLKALKWLHFSGEYMLNGKKIKSSWQNANVLVTNLGFYFDF